MQDNDIIIFKGSELKEYHKHMIQDTVREVLAQIKGEKNPEELVRVQDLAEEFNLSAQTMFDRIAARHIPTERMGPFKAVKWKYKDKLLKK